MNELERLRALVNAGQATAQELEKFEMLLKQSNNNMFGNESSKLEGEEQNTNSNRRLPQIFGAPGQYLADLYSKDQYGNIDDNRNIPNPNPNPNSNPDYQQLFGYPSNFSEPTLNNIEDDFSVIEGEMAEELKRLGRNTSNGESPEVKRVRDLIDQGYSAKQAQRKVEREFSNNPTGEDTGDFRLPFIYPGGSDISTELYTLGRAIGAPKGSRGRAATGISAGVAAASDAARNIFSGVGFEKRNAYVDQYYRDRLKDNNYTANPQSNNVNNIGSFYGEGGGETGMDFLQKGSANPQEDMLTTKDGGVFNYQAGDTITFEIEGKKMTKKIKSISNGKFITE